jgi:small-conductance mechanosensitive channel
MVVLGDLGTQISDAFGNAINELLLFIPALIGALILLLVGWIVASIVKNIVLRILRAIHFDNLLARTGITGLMQRGGVRADAASIFAGLVYWFIFLIFVVAAAKALGVDAITTIVTAIVLFLPNVLVALIIIVIGALIARFVGDLVRTSVDAAGVSGAGILSGLARYAILAFAFILALNQIGVGAAIVQTLFTAVIGGLSLAIAIAFGLGGRDTAKNIVDSWYTSLTGRRVGDQIDTTTPRRIPPTA